MKAITVYSCSYGDFHPPMEPHKPDPGCVYTYFTDRDDPINPDSVWVPKKMVIPNCSSRRASRFAKILSDYFFSTDFSIYVDAGLVLTESPDRLIEEIKVYDFGVFKHTRRRYLMQEANRIGKLFPEMAEAAVEQAKRLSKLPKTELAECGLLVRRNNVRTLALNHIWWAFFSMGPERDQISFPCAAELSSARIKWFESEISNNRRCCSTDRYINGTWKGFAEPMEKKTK